MTQFKDAAAQVVAKPEINEAVGADRPVLLSPREAHLALVAKETRASNAHR